MTNDELYRSFLALLEANADVSQAQLTDAINGVSAGSFTLPANTIAGNDTGASALAKGITLGAGLTFSGGALTISGGGTGDMSKAVYDPNDDGKVNSAVTADSAGDSTTVGGNTPAQLRDRSTHTGTQLLSTISDAGTSAALNVPAIGDAASGEVVRGNDSRLTDERVPTDGSVITQKLVNGSVTTAKLGDNSVSTAKLLNGAVTTSKLDANAVTTLEVADDAITLDKIATITANRLLGSDNSGNPIEVTLGTNVSLTGGVLSATGGGGSGDMTKAVYDTNDDGVVNNSSLLGGQNSAYHLARANHTGTQALSTISDAGTAASRNVAVAGNASTTEVVKGDDTRLTDTRVPTDDTVSTAKIQNLAVSEGKIAAAAVTTSKVANGAVTYAKLQDTTQQALLGSQAAGAVTEVTIGSGLSMTAGVLSATGGGGGSGDMTKAVYDTDDNGTVDNSELLEGNNSAYHLNRANHTGTQPKSTISDIASLYPVGSVYMNASVATNPATLLGFGTWVSFGAGRVLVGLDSGDTDFDTVEETGGAKTHTLTQAEMPSHTHTGTTNEAAWAQVGGNPALQFSGSGLIANNVPLTFTTSSAGTGAAHNNLQPYIVVYMWKRTA